MRIEYKLEQIDVVVKQILDAGLQRIVLFRGEMGAGKTTLIKELCKQLGVEGATSSPTFSLVNEYYVSETERIFHFDMYRLKREEEALDMGIEDYFYSGNWCFVEWSENIPNLIPEEHSILTINILETGLREIEIP